MSLPPPNVTRAVIQRFARAQHRFRFDSARLVLPTGEFFPDEFTADEISAKLLVARLQELAGLNDIPISAKVISTRPSQLPSSSCSSGACTVPQSSRRGISRLVDQGDEWVLQIPEDELNHPIALTTNLVRSLAYVYLVETKHEEEVIEPPVDITADIVAVGLGFGPLLLQGSYLYAKSCGGPQVASLTKLTVHELAVATALFARLHAQPLKKALPHFEITQREALHAAHVLLASNPGIEKSLKQDLESLCHGHFELHERKSILGRLLSRRPSSKKLPSSLNQLDPKMDLETLEEMVMDMPHSSRMSRRPNKSSADDLSKLVAESMRETQAARQS